MDWKQLAAKLANMGLPVLGKAIGTLVGSQIPFVGGFVGDAGENIGAAAAKMIADALGVEPAADVITADAINRAIETQPTTDVVTKLRAAENEASAKWAALVGLAHEDTEALRAGLADNEAARRQMLELVKVDAPQAWAPAVVSIMVVFSFMMILVLWLFYPPTSDPLTLTVLNILIGTLAAAFGQVISYWLGSSSGSKDKDTALKAALAGAQINTNQAIAAPAKTAAAGKPAAKK